MEFISYSGAYALLSMSYQYIIYDVYVHNIILNHTLLELQNAKSAAYSVLYETLFNSLTAVLKGSRSDSESEL